MKNKRRRDRDAAAQWGQLELAIPGISQLIEGRSMEKAIYPPSKPPQTEEAALTLHGMHVTEKKA